MTIAEIIDMVDDLKPNKFTDEQKISWLSDCDSVIFKDVISTHERQDGDPETFSGYAADVDVSTKLIVDAPHDQLYRYYLEMQIDQGNMEMAKYNNSAALYNQWLANYAGYYNRTHMPKSVKAFTY